MTRDVLDFQGRHFTFFFVVREVESCMAAASAMEGITVSSLDGARGFGGPIVDAPCTVGGMLRLRNGSVLVADTLNHCIRLLTAEVATTAAGDGTAGHRDGVAAQAQFHYPRFLAQLLDGRIIVTEFTAIRLLSADMTTVTTVVGGEQVGCNPGGLAVLPDGCVLVAERTCIRKISADLQTITMIAGNASRESRTAARLMYPCGLVVLPDSSVLVADSNRILRLSADLAKVTMVARFSQPHTFALLHDGRVLVASDSTLRILSADLQTVHTVLRRGAGSLVQLPDGSVLMGTGSTITVLTDFPSAAWCRRRALLLALAHADRPGCAPPALSVLGRLAALLPELRPSVFCYV